MAKGTAVLACVLAACVATYAANVMEISTVDELLKLRDEMKDAAGAVYTKDIEITATLNLTDGQLTQPLGTRADGTCTVYSGTLHGNGNSIMGFKLGQKDEMAEAAFFCGLKDVTVEELTFDDQCAMAATNKAAMLALKASGTVALVNVHNMGTVSSANASGLLVDADTTSLTITECSNTGTITVQHVGAGLVVHAGTMSKQAAGAVVLTQCKNTGNIIASGSSIVYAGLFAAVCGEEVAIEDCTNGAGLSQREVTKSIVAGGVVAVIGGDGTVTVSRCKNEGSIATSTNSTEAGGIVGKTVGFSGTLVIEDSFNTGAIDVSKQQDEQLAVGGVLGIYYSEAVTQSVIRRCNNSAEINVVTNTPASGYVAGICGSVSNVAGSKSLTVSSCINTGAIKTESIACGVACGKEKMTVQNSANTAAVHGTLTYGIANAVEAADNVASIGALDIKSAALGNALWALCGAQCTNAYQSVTEGEDTYIVKKEDGFYYTSSDDRRVDQALNDQVRAMRYELSWTTGLTLDFESEQPSSFESSLIESSSFNDSNISDSSDSSSSGKSSASTATVRHFLQFVAACMLGAAGLLL